MKSTDPLIAALTSLLPHGRVVSDPLRTFAYGTDASFYRLVPRVVVIVDSERELDAVLAVARAQRAPLTFRAAGTSLSGQAITDSVLVLLGDAWRRAEVLDNGAAIRLGPAVRGGEANRLLAPYGRKIGPDPASIESAQIGGIAANNASGMCCGTRDNSYHTLRAMRIVFADGSLLDTGDADSVGRFRESRADLLAGLSKLSRQVRRDPALTARIRHKYRLKNTTGYGLNALIDFDDPVDIASHLMIGSEGTLGFISSVTYRTVVDHAIKAASLLIFDDLHSACSVVTQLAKAPVAAVELMDRAALASAQGKPGMPVELATLGGEGVALLVEARAADEQELEKALRTIEGLLAESGAARPWRFTRDAAEIAQLWKLRKGTFPSVGAVRKTGTTVVIEDVAFPVERLADATIELQRTLHKHGYGEAIIFGHALAGNLHFVFTQDFASASEVARYAALIDDVVRLVVERYDGSLKAEHGTGRNMAPFVEREWGSTGTVLMQEIKRLFDPDGLLNPDVILSSDPQAHLRHLKALPAADPIIDKCIECGFCEPVCPSAGLTLSPRQRITSWREIQRRQASAEDGSGLLGAYQYAGIDSCAACGLCATVCPVGIETGRLIKSLRAAQATPLASAIGRGVASNFGATTGAVRLGLKVVDGLHGALGTRTMARMTGTARALSGNRLPKWTAAMPRAGKRVSAAKLGEGDRVVYFPSCASRTMAPARGDPVSEDLRSVTERVLQRAGYQVIYPPGLDAQCCGQPFESKGLADSALKMAGQLETALRAASEDGALPIVFDTSPCAYRMKQALVGALPVHDLTEFLHDKVLPRLTLQRSPGPVALHAVCSVIKMGLHDKLAAIARACSETVVEPPDVTCCGWAGDRGFTVPELNAHALRTLKSGLPADCSSGYSTSRTCEIGLSEHSGIDYRSIMYLVDAANAPR